MVSSLIKHLWFTLYLGIYEVKHTLAEPPLDRCV